MRFVSVRELKGKSGEVWKGLKKDGEVILTSNGKPIAMISPVDENTVEESLSALRRARAIQAVEQIQSRSLSEGTDKITLDEINQEIEAVRRDRRR